ncbi:MAG: hypothetical protein HRU80_02355 [Ignavibacteriales bacterium]|nr:MAG: hypothetical protein HRU80_02355 [Ignavibacteriales bacterium]
MFERFESPAAKIIRFKDWRFCERAGDDGDAGLKSSLFADFWTHPPTPSLSVKGKFCVIESFNNSDDFYSVQICSEKEGA